MGEKQAAFVLRQKTTRVGTTAKRREISDRLLKLFHLLVTEQRCAYKTAKNDLTLNKLRLAAYDRYQKAIMDAVFELTDTLRLKQAGGRPTHKHFNLGYELLKKHYIETGEILKPQALSKKVWTELIKTGRGPKSPKEELFPTRIASNIISLFKICLPFEDFFEK